MTLTSNPLTKKTISCIAAAMLVASFVPASAIAEAPEAGSAAMVGPTNAEVAEPDDVGHVDVEAQLADPDQTPADPVIASQVEGPDAVMRMQVASNQDAASLSRPATSIDQPTAGDLADIRYVYIDQDVVAPADSQYLLVGFASSLAPFSDAMLTIVGEDGSSVEKSASRTTSSAALFEYAAGSLAAGRYSVSSLSIAGTQGVTAYGFDGDAYDCSFKVADAVRSLEDVMAEGGIYAVDEGGSIVEQRSVEGALRTAGAMAAGEEREGLTPQSSMVVLLDPGHGGSDPGASANGLVEKDLNLKIALACRDELSEYNGVTVKMTRETDATVELATRAQMARNYGAAVIIGIHNDSGREKARGSSVIIPLTGREHEVGDALGNEILAQLTELGLRDRGTWAKAGSQGDYYYLIREPKKSGIPGIIIEHAFLTNPDDAAFLASDANLAAMGVADATGIACYFGLTKDTAAFFAPVYDYSYYVASNPDVKAAFRGDRDAVFMHFLTWGMSEGRKSSPSFDLASYYNRYGDLRYAYGLDLKEYYTHYLLHGRREGRVATGTAELVSYITIQDGRDYSAVYDGSTYRHRYSDLDKAFTKKVGLATLYDDKALLAHFLEWGMMEGRSASDKFSVADYYHAYIDLRQAFGMSIPSYYRHYVDNGIREGRTAVRGQQMVGFVTIAAGIDYSPVYDGAYYWDGHADLRSAFTRKIGEFTFVDDNALLNHFREWGMREGRRASRYFDLDCYYKGNPDLRQAFGTTDWSHYYMHYIVCGQREGRIAFGSDQVVTDGHSAIMGNSQVTPAQMVARYRQSGAIYPSSVYAPYGAPDIGTFCAIVYQEANAEGVRAEIVFAQAMHETGWLRYGGDVSPEQCNFAGIGATGGVPGCSFNEYGSDSVRMGIRAQVQHLKAYASTDSLNNRCVDPRFDLVRRGCAPSVYDLSGKWATGAGYGDRVMALVDSIIAI